MSTAADDGGELGLPSMTVVLPTFAENASLGATVAALLTAIGNAGWANTEILIVDDGSPTPVEETLHLPTSDTPIRIHRIPNSGRLRAREAGLEEASGSLIMFIDSRVHIHPGALRFLRDVFLTQPGRKIWNGHAVTAASWKPWTHFWDAIAFVAWRRYLASPRDTHYGEAEFEHFPKGTTMFLAPKPWILEALDAVDSRSKDPKLANDDTLMIRNLLAFGDINISPEFSCTYHPRQSLQAFMKNAYHRGSVLVDGHLRPGLRWYRPFLLVAASGPFALALALVRPKLAASSAGLGVVGAGIAVRSLGATNEQAIATTTMSIPFSVVYGAGIIRGFLRRTGT